MGHPMRLELTRVGLLVKLANRYTTKGALEELTVTSLLVWLGQTDHKLVWVILRLANRPSLAGYWKFNTSLLEIGDIRERLDPLIHPVLVEAVTGNRWWGSLKYRIRDFAIKYGRQLKLDRTKKTKSLEDKLSRAVER